MSPVLIIGFGSTLRGDDALGPLVAERLEEMLGDCVDVEVRQSLTPELAANIATAELVLFIDCCAEGRPGQLLCRQVRAGAGQSLAMVHFLDPAALLTWTGKLYGRIPLAYTIATPGVSFAFGEELSPTVADMVPKLIDKALALIEKHVTMETCHA